MENFCVIRKIKAVINNETLLKPGWFYVTIDNTGGNAGNFEVQVLGIKVISDNEITVENNQGKEFLANSSGWIEKVKFPTGVTKMIVKSNYDNLFGCTFGKGCIFNTEIFKARTKFGSINIIDNDIAFDLSLFDNKTLFNLILDKSTNITGNLNNSAMKLESGVFKLSLIDTNIKGTIEGFMANVIKYKQNGTINFFGNNYITYNGSVIGNGVNKTIRITNGNYTVS